MNKKEIAEFFDLQSENWDKNVQIDTEKMNTIMNAAKIKESISVLDIACGTGVLFPYYLDRGVSRITGVDISGKMIKRAQSKFGNSEQICLICADADTYHFSEKYDCCMVFNALPHFCNPMELLANLKTAVKFGGTLTVAHDMGRRMLDMHHAHKAHAVSCGLISEDELEKILLSLGFKDIFKLATDSIYIVSGIKGENNEQI